MTCNLSKEFAIKNKLGRKKLEMTNDFWAVRIPQFILSDKQFSVTQKFLLSTLLSMSNKERFISNRKVLKQTLKDLYQISDYLYDGAIKLFKKIGYLEETATRFKLNIGKFQCVSDYVQVDYNIIPYIRDRLQCTSDRHLLCALIYSTLKNHRKRHSGEYQASSHPILAKLNTSYHMLRICIGTMNQHGILKTTGIYDWRRDLTKNQKFTYNLRIPELKPKIIHKAPNLMPPTCGPRKKNALISQPQQKFGSKQKSEKYFRRFSRQKTPQQYSNYIYIYREIFEKGGLNLIQKHIKVEVWERVFLSSAEFDQLSEIYGKMKVWEMVVTLSKWKRLKNAQNCSDFYELKRGWLLDRGAWEDQKIAWTLERRAKEQKQREYEMKIKFENAGKIYSEHEIQLEKEREQAIYRKQQRAQIQQYKDPFEGYTGYR